MYTLLNTKTNRECIKNQSIENLYKWLKYDNPQDLNDRKVRLFPFYSKIQDENSTSSIFLSCLSVIKDFQKEFFEELEVKLNSNDQIHTYFQTSLNTNDRPDAFICISSGKRYPIIKWSGLIEFKTKEN